MFVPFLDEGIISQFEGYEELEELDWDDYRERYRTSSALTASSRPRAMIPTASSSPSRPMRCCCSSSSRRWSCGTCSSASITSTPPTPRADRRVLRPAHLARLDAELHRPRQCTGGVRWRRLMGAVSGRARERNQRPAGGHDQGRHPHGRDVRHARLRPASLRRHPRPRRGAVLFPQVHRAPGWAVVLDSVSRHAAASVA